MRREWNSSLLEWGVGLTVNHGLRRDNKPFLKPQVDASPDRRMGDAAPILARATRDVGSTMEAMLAMKAMTATAEMAFDMHAHP